MLEVRDEEAIQQVQPALEAVARSAGRRLFADVSDADLTRLGVDAQILPVVRLLTSEADLEALQPMLPEAQYAALYALAARMTVEEAWAEVAQLLPGDAPPEQVDPGDLVSAMKRTPGHYSGPSQVTGGPGTGKTVTALHRAAFLASRAEPQPGNTAPQPFPPGPGARPVLLTTFTSNLTEALDAQFDLLIQDADVRSRIEVINVDRLAYRIVKQARGSPVIADERVLRARWAEAVADAGLAFTPAFLKNEWEQVILAQDLHTTRT